MKRLKGYTTAASDKSISHRGIMFGSLADGKTYVKNFLKSEDCLSTVSCLKALGADISVNGPEAIVNGVNMHGFRESDSPLYTGNSGTTTRMLSGILCGLPFTSTVFGDDSLNKRPMNRIIEPLTLMGAKFEAANGGFCPMKITGGNLKGIEYTLPVASAQLKSAIILAGLYADGETIIHEKVKSRDHTERMLKGMGANIKTEGNTIIVQKSENLKPLTVDVPGDISSAAFFIVGACILPDSDVVIRNVGLNETRTGILDVLKAMGADIEIENHRICYNEEIGDIHVKYSPLSGCEIGGEIIPRLIDEIPIIAVAAAAAKGETVIRDAHELRVKESDRIKAVAEMLNTAGVTAQELPDGLIIHGANKIKGASYDSYKDHRIAMSAKILSLLTDEPSEIKDFSCVNISFPEFSKNLEELLK